MKGLSNVAITVLVVLLMVAACGATASPTVVPTLAPTTAAPTKAPTQAPPTTAPPTKPAPTAAPPTPTEGPKVGGKLIYAITYEYETMDPAYVSGSTIIDELGASLVKMAPDASYVPYLAESWSISDDGLTWEFKLKKGVKFHDGTPFTAKDYVWTFERYMDPATKAGLPAEFLASVERAEAPDDYTFRIVMQKPVGLFLHALANVGYMQPLSQAAVTKYGETYGRHPVGTGPYMFKEWVTGDHITLVRNPDFNWGPSYMHKGPCYIEEIEFRIIPEYSTVIAGLEAGEIGLFPAVQVNDVARLKGTEKVQFFEGYLGGNRPSLWMNVQVPPFDDIRVRQAMNYAVDKEALAKAAYQGAAVPAYGPISRSVIGYWPGVEKIGYKYDLNRARQLLKEAGWTPGPDGILVKDGKRFEFAVQICNLVGEPLGKVGEVLREQYKAVGISLDLQIRDVGIYIQQCGGGECELSLCGLTETSAGLMRMQFHSTVAAFNFGQLKDAEYDELLESSVTTVDPVQRQELMDKAQQVFVENAWAVPLVTPIVYSALTSRVKGAVFSDKTGQLYLGDAYFVDAK